MQKEVAFLTCHHKEKVVAPVLLKQGESVGGANFCAHEERTVCDMADRGLTEAAANPLS